MIKNDFNLDIDFDDFEDIELNLEDSFENRYIKPPRTLEVPENLLKYDNAEKLAKAIKFAKGDRFHIRLNGSFIFGDFIEAFIVVNNYHVKELSVSTLSLSENNVDSFANLLNGGFVDKLNLVVSDYFFSHERRNLVPYLYKELDKKNRFQLAAAGVHTKIVLIETHCGMKYYFHGSANLRSSANIEQVCLEENEMLFDWSKIEQDNIIEQYKTIDKSIRGKELWRLITK